MSQLYIFREKVKYNKAVERGTEREKEIKVLQFSHKNMRWC